MVGGSNNAQKNTNDSRDQNVIPISLPILDFNLRNIAEVSVASHKVCYLNNIE